jgi:HAD superfamily hydrolase (TIGR01662 family)
LTIRAVIFDLGHTLWDIRRDQRALERAYADLRATLARRLHRDDLPSANALMRAVGQALRNSYFSAVVDELDTGSVDTLKQPPSHIWIDSGCSALGLQLELDLLLEVTPPLFATEIDNLVSEEGTLAALEALAAAGYRLGCVTNTLAGAPAIHEMLRRHGFETLMRSVVVSAEEGWRKPHPSLFEKALRELEVEPAESLFVGDSPVHDIAGAKAAGMRAVLTRQYVARTYESLEPQPDAVVDHIRELPDVIRRLDGKAATGTG